MSGKLDEHFKHLKDSILVGKNKLERREGDMNKRKGDLILNGVILLLWIVETELLGFEELNKIIYTF